MSVCLCGEAGGRGVGGGNEWIDWIESIVIELRGGDVLTRIYS